MDPKPKNVELIMFLVIISVIGHTNGDCCINKIKTSYLCPRFPHHIEPTIIEKSDNICYSFICMDGLALGKDGYYCGQGICNVFGCNCDGGCRGNSKGTKVEARRLFGVRYGLKVIYAFVNRIKLPIFDPVNDKNFKSNCSCSAM